MKSKIKQVEEALPYLQEEKGSFTLKDVKEATGIWNSSASVSLMTLEKKGHLVRISRGLYRLAEPVKTPDPVSFEDVVYKIKQFEGAEFTVSDIRSKFIS
ncbi:MAG: type IV toxin-antitoxin system AbiEi family antitoxin domain-containing protein, partial [Thermodesulfobacteriota bacterium]